MSLIEIFRAVILNIKSNKVRVFLTSLGIIVGAFTIIMVVGIGKGSQADIEKQYENLSVETLFTMKGRGVKSSENLDLDDVVSLKEQTSSAIKDACIIVSGNANITNNDNSDTASVAGTTQEFLEINSLELEYGEFITAEQNDNKERAAVLGQDLVEVLFGEVSSEVIGQEIKLNGKRYEIVGILKKSGKSLPGFVMDEGVIVPYETSVKYIVGANANSKIAVSVHDIEYIEEAKSEIMEIINENHNGKSDDFSILDAGSKLTAAQEAAQTMTALLISVAACVLVVGGIGIMNVLLVSVKERTREIGILKAIGARKRDILLQFLLEAVIISASGGIMGIIASIFVAPVMDIVGITFIPSVLGYVLGIVFSVVTGTFFGYYPATKAAKLKPIDALREE